MGSLIAPARAALLREKFNDPGLVKAEVVKYRALYHYSPTWNGLAVSLVREGEAKAAEMARHHVHAVTGM